MKQELMQAIEADHLRAMEYVDRAHAARQRGDTIAVSQNFTEAFLLEKQAAEAIHSCLLFHGWSGYGNDIPFAQRYRDIVGFEIGDGTAEIMKAIIARDTFGREFAAYK